MPLWLSDIILVHYTSTWILLLLFGASRTSIQLVVRSSAAFQSFLHRAMSNRSEGLVEEELRHLVLHTMHSCRVMKKGVRNVIACNKMLTYSCDAHIRDSVIKDLTLTHSSLCAEGEEWMRQHPDEPTGCQWIQHNQRMVSKEIRLAKR